LLADFLINPLFVSINTIDREIRKSNFLKTRK